MLVLLKTPPTVAISGTVRPFVVAEVEREYQVNSNLEVTRQLETKYQNRPILLVEAVYP